MPTSSTWPSDQKPFAQKGHPTGFEGETGETRIAANEMQALQIFQEFANRAGKLTPHAKNDSQVIHLTIIGSPDQRDALDDAAKVIGQQRGPP